MTEPLESDIDKPSDQAALDGALDGLSQIVAGQGSLKGLLTLVAGFAADAIPGADGAGVTMTEGGRADTIVASDTFVRDVDEFQYRLGEGPCVSAAALARTTVSGELGADGRWPTFGPHAAESGIHSVISLPLVVEGEVLGSLNVYARAKNAFGVEARTVGEKFAVPAAVAIGNARLLRRTQRGNVELTAAFAAHSAVQQAVGVIMNRSNVDASAAFVQLRIMSQQESRDVADVAADLLKSFPDRVAAPVSVTRADYGDSVDGRQGMSATFISDDHAPARARAHVLRILAACGTDLDTSSDTEVLVSEVVSNVVRHEHPHAVRVEVDVATPGSITVTVAGSGSGPSTPMIPSTGPPPPDRESGRGLSILDSLAWTWGTRRQFRRTTVWFTVRDRP